MGKEFYADGWRTVGSVSELPTEPYFAVIKFGSIYIEGDERSRTNPGHGYPGHSQTTIEYYIFKDKASWEKYIDKLIHPTYGNPEKNWQAVYVTPAMVQTKTQVVINLLETDNNTGEELNR